MSSSSSTFPTEPLYLLIYVIIFVIIIVLLFHLLGHIWFILPGPHLEEIITQTPGGPQQQHYLYHIIH